MALRSPVLFACATLFQLMKACSHLTLLIREKGMTPHGSVKKHINTDFTYLLTLMLC